MSKLIEIGTFDIPEWAVCYYSNGESSASEEDMADADAFYEEIGGGEYLCMDFGDCEAEFTHYPAFGLACDTIKTTIYKVATKADTGVLL